MLRARPQFNCFFLMPVVDTFPARLRSEMEAAYECGVEGLFDVCGARGALEGRLKALTSEVHQVRGGVNDYKIAGTRQDVYLRKMCGMAVCGASTMRCFV